SRRRRRVAPPEDRLARPRDPVDRLAIRVRIRHVLVARHPVVFVRGPLLGRQQRQQCRQRVQRETLPRREEYVLTDPLEVVRIRVLADDPPSAVLDLDAQVVQLKNSFIVHVTFSPLLSLPWTL